MQKDSGKILVSNDVRQLLNKKELKIVDQGSPGQIKHLSSKRIKQYVKLVRKLRDKYRDLTQRQKIELKKVPSGSQGLITKVEKAKVFDKVLKAFEKQSKKLKTKSTSKKSQKTLDHEQHYDLDGVTRIDNKVVIPSNAKFKKATKVRKAL